MREIALSQGYVALVDDEDYEWLSKWKWRVRVKPHTAYAMRHSGGRNETTIMMHQAVAGTPPGMDTDHINGDGLDNRRSNLRVCTRGENMRNSRSHLGSLSLYKGVSWHKQARKWVANIGVGGCKRHLGYFSVEAEAAEVYKLAAAIVHGAFAAGARGDRVRGDKPQERSPGGGAATSTTINGQGA